MSEPGFVLDSSLLIKLHRDQPIELYPRSAAVVETLVEELEVVRGIAQRHPVWVQGAKNAADPFMIAASLAVVVTDEGPWGRGTEDRNLPIPTVAAELDVECSLPTQLIRAAAGGSDVVENIRRGWRRIALADVGTWYGGCTPSKGRSDYCMSRTVPWRSPRNIRADVIAAGAGITDDSNLDNAPFTDRGGIDGAIRDFGALAGASLEQLSAELTS